MVLLGCLALCVLQRLVNAEEKSSRRDCYRSWVREDYFLLMSLTYFHFFYFINIDCLTTPSWFEEAVKTLPSPLSHEDNFRPLFYSFRYFIYCCIYISIKTWSGEVTFSIVAQYQRRGWQDFEKKNWRGETISPDYVLCHILRAMAIIGKKWKFRNLLVRKRRPLWCQWQPLCGFENFEKKIQNFGFFCKYWKLWRILKNYEL